MSAYNLCLFGGFDLKDDQGAAIPIRSKKGRCLLAYLALAQGEQKPRDELAALLWGDRGDTQARRSLSQELYRLRGLFPEDVQDGFVLEAESVGLAEGLFDVDVVNFERGPDSGGTDTAVLYTGDLLAGQEANQETFDDWLRDERERLRERAVAGLHDVLATRLSGPADAALESANRLLALDPLSENAHRAVMQTHANAGRRDLALKQYEKCRALLAEELGIEPDGETNALYEQIKSEAPAAPAAEPTFDSVTADEAPPLPSKPSIAVLPFDNMSGDAEQEYFSDGIADDIITGLARFHDLFVIARNSSFTYKGQARDVKQIGRELGVRYLLEGGVRKAGERVRITAQLIEAESGNNLWAEKYDGELTDIFDLQDEITESVVGIVQPTIMQAEIERVRRKHPDNLDAYDLLLQGWAHGFEMDKQGLQDARGCFDKAIALDDRMAQAHIGLAEAYFWEAILGWRDDMQQGFAEAILAAQRAIAIDESDAVAHACLCWPLVFSGRTEDALAELERAVELSPNNARAHCLRGLVFCQTGRGAEGADEARMALRLSPRDGFRFLFLHCLAECQYSARDYAGAAESAAKVIALKPDYLYGYWHLAGACAQLGQTERARSALAEVLRLNPGFDRAFVEAVAPYQPTDLEHLIEGLTKAGWKG